MAKSKSIKRQKKSKRLSSSKTGKRRRVRGGEGETPQTWSDWWNNIWKPTPTQQPTTEPNNETTTTEPNQQQNQ